MQVGLSEARAALAAAVETQGRDFVYDNFDGACYYYPLENVYEEFEFEEFKDQFEQWGLENHSSLRTGCLVGVALDILGMLDCPKNYMLSINTSFEDNWFGTKLTQEAIEYLGIAQRLQDESNTWGQAFDKAEEYARALEPS